MANTPATQSSANGVYVGMVALAESADLTKTLGQFYREEMVEADLAQGLQQLLAQLEAEAPGRSATDVSSVVQSFLQNAEGFQGTMAVATLTAMISGLQTEAKNIAQIQGEIAGLNGRIASLDGRWYVDGKVYEDKADVPSSAWQGEYGFCESGKTYYAATIDKLNGEVVADEQNDLTPDEDKANQMVSQGTAALQSQASALQLDATKGLSLLQHLEDVAMAFASSAYSSESN